MDIETTMITTAFDLPNYSITQSFGLARGISVRSRSFLGSIGASLETILGGNLKLFTELCEKTRQDAFELLIKEAEKLGANAIIGFRYDANEIAAGVTEVLAYGTAVLVVKK